MCVCVRHCDCDYRLYYLISLITLVSDVNVGDVGTQWEKFRKIKRKMLHYFHSRFTSAESLITFLSVFVFIFLNFKAPQPKTKNSARLEKHSSGWIRQLLWLFCLIAHFCFIFNCLINVSIWKYACPVLEFKCLMICICCNTVLPFHRLNILYLLGS